MATKQESIKDKYSKSQILDAIQQIKPNPVSVE